MSAIPPEERRVLFGELHLHTALSFDAWTYGTKLMPDDAYRFGSGSFDFRHGLALQPTSAPLGLGDPRLASARARDKHFRAFLVWSRMPIVVRIDGRTYLTDQRFYSLSTRLRTGAFLIPLDNPGANS